MSDSTYDPVAGVTWGVVSGGQNVRAAVVLEAEHEVIHNGNDFTGGGAPPAGGTAPIPVGSSPPFGPTNGLAFDGIVPSSGGSSNTNVGPNRAKIVVAGWFKPGASLDTGLTYTILSNDDGTGIVANLSYDAGWFLTVTIVNAGFDAETQWAIPVGDLSAWHHFAVSSDLGASPGAGPTTRTSAMYDGVAVNPAGIVDLGTGTAHFGQIMWIGQSAGASPFKGCLAQIAFSRDAYYDMTNPTTQAIFYNAGPVDTASLAAILFYVLDGDTAAAFFTNQGLSLVTFTAPTDHTSACG